MSNAEDNGGLDLNQFHALGCALSTSAIEAFTSASCTNIEEYLNARTNKS